MPNKTRKKSNKKEMKKQKRFPKEVGFSSSIPTWYRLDNAAKIYPATMQRNWNSVYRLSATLNQSIKPDILRKALTDLRPRFPSFFVILRKGLFWYYLESAESLDIVQEESEYPCRPFPVGVGKKPLFRILYYKSRISFEAFHSVTDGFGGLAFLKSLVYRYLELCGTGVTNPDKTILEYHDDPTKEELTDSFRQYYQPTPKGSRKEPKAYVYKERHSNDDKYFRIITGTFSVEELKKITKPKGVTITQYLTALYILSFANNMRGPNFLTGKQRKANTLPVRISVPVNLRKPFPSASLRNFSFFANVGLSVTSEITIDDILASIVPQLNAGFEKDRLLRAFGQNVRSENNLAVKITPLSIKNLILRLVNKLYGESRFTSAFSNLGIVDLPESMHPHVREVGMILGPSPNNGINLSAISYEDKMSMTFSSRFPDVGVQSFFFRHLAEQGIKVEVESNV